MDSQPSVPADLARIQPNSDWRDPGKLNRISTAHMQAFLPLSSRQGSMVTICVAFTTYQEIILSLKGCAEIPCDYGAVLYEGFAHPWIPGPAGIQEPVSCESRGASEEIRKDTE